MKFEIVKHEKLKGYDLITILIQPTWFRKIFFGDGPYEWKFIDSGREYVNYGLKVWYNYPELSEYGRFEELDIFLRKKEFEEELQGPDPSAKALLNQIYERAFTKKA